MEDILFWVAFALVILGALNSGVISLGARDLICAATKDMPTVTRVFKASIGVAGLVLLYTTFTYYQRMEESKRYGMAGLRPAGK